MWPMMVPRPDYDKPDRMRWLVGRDIALDVTEMVRASVTGGHHSADKEGLADYDVSVVLQRDYGKVASTSTPWTVWTTPDKREAELVLRTIAKWACGNGRDALVITEFLAEHAVEEAKKAAQVARAAEQAAKREREQQEIQAAAVAAVHREPEPRPKRSDARKQGGSGRFDAAG